MTLVSELDTPAVTVDLDIVEANIKRAQDLLAGHGVNNRPHIKTHKIPALAKMQIDAGAVGITCQKLGEVEVFADAGVADDILLTYNIVGESKTERLAALIKRLKRMAVVLDNETVAKGLSEAGKRHGVDIRFLIECDTGYGRNGVQSPQAALDLARDVMKMPNMQFEGLMTFPTAKPEQRQWLERALQLLQGAGIPVPVVSGGGSPAIKGVGDFPMLTEYRAGTYIYNDVMQVTTGAVTWDDCAMKVRATVVSRPTDDRAVLDTGSKVMTYEQYFAKGYGRIVEYPEAEITGFSEEHGMVNLSASAQEAEGRRGRQRDPEPLLRRHQHDGRDLRRARRQGRGRVAGRGARQGALTPWRRPNSRRATTASFPASSSIRPARPRCRAMRCGASASAIPIPLKEGFARVEAIIREAGRPLTSFCACELRSPAPFTDQGFRAFNEIYVVTLQKWGIYDGKVNPVARSNVCPEIDPPAEPSFYAFSFTVPSKDTAPSFVIAGSGEAREGGATYKERTVRYGETSADAMAEKARHVLGEMERRLGAFGYGWADTTASQVYTVFDLHPFLARRDRAPRRRPRRADVAFRAAAGGRARIRDGLPQRRRRAGRLTARCRRAGTRRSTFWFSAPAWAA